MRVRDLQQILGKFTLNEKGTIVSDCPIYIETMDGHLEAVRKIELQESKLIGKANSSAAWRVVLKQDKKFISLQSTTYRQ